MSLAQPGSPAASVATSSAGVALRPASVITNPSGPLSAFDMARVWAMERSAYSSAVRQLRSSLVTIASAAPTMRPSTVRASALASQPLPPSSGRDQTTWGETPSMEPRVCQPSIRTCSLRADLHRHAALVEGGFEGVGHAAGVVEDFDGVVGLEQGAAVLDGYELAADRRLGRWRSLLVLGVGVG